MGVALIKMKIMPESPDVDLESIKAKATEIVEGIDGKVTNSEEEPIAFGLKALNIFLSMDENVDTSKVEEPFSKIEGVSSAEIADYRRQI